MTTMNAAVLDRFDDQAVIPSLGNQLGLDLGAEPLLRAKPGVFFEAPDIDLNYDLFVVAFSGGKDSWASYLRLIELGVPRSRIEMWFHDVDGREGSTLMEWPFMADYNRKLAAELGVQLYASWLVGGFEGELNKENAYSAPHKVETPDGVITLLRDTSRAKPGTRQRFPQVSADLNVRWCSSTLKIDVARRAINNQARFNGLRICFVTGERREESPNRAKYNQLEPHACDRRKGRLARHVDTWRPVLHFNESDVWEIMERHGVLAPIPYRLSWPRSSCRSCIFNSPSIWATLRRYFPGSVETIAAYERKFDTTISRDRINVMEIADKATPFNILDEEALAQAFKAEYTLPIIDRANWTLPAGAFSNVKCGPT
ncbi:hypothetical protein [Halomonas sp. KO116]|uniref:hypothetical protein n=1 Tax=Halomonas sp. KO116 TaxID=1504981 RepID=UPI0004E3DDA0|nr:phosphoadenosine phosphosulfate reductase [Halomonas sp. KO116]